MADWMFIVMGFLLILLFFLVAHQIKLSRENKEICEKYDEAVRNMEIRARDIFESWRSNELESQKQTLVESFRKEYDAKFHQWKSREEKGIREDAINQSRAVIMGKVTEHIIPYFEDFNYNPRDARFIGTPVDFIVFDGMCEGEVKQVVFVEVKTGTTGQLSKTERQIKSAVDHRNVCWDKVHYNSNKSDFQKVI